MSPSFPNTFHTPDSEVKTVLALPPNSPQEDWVSQSTVSPPTEPATGRSGSNPQWTERANASYIPQCLHWRSVLGWGGTDTRLLHMVPLTASVMR